MRVAISSGVAKKYVKSLCGQSQPQRVIPEEARSKGCGRVVLLALDDVKPVSRRSKNVVYHSKNKIGPVDVSPSMSSH